MKFASVPTLVLLAAAALPAPAAAAPANKGLPYAVTAERGAEYQLTCKFRAIRQYGGLVNQYTVRQKGASKGRLPSDNGRCTLVKLGGKGEIVLTIVKGGAKVARAAVVGQPVKLTVL